MISKGFCWWLFLGCAIKKMKSFNKLHFLMCQDAFHKTQTISKLKQHPKKLDLDVCLKRRKLNLHSNIYLFNLNFWAISTRDSQKKTFFPISPDATKKTVKEKRKLFTIFSHRIRWIIETTKWDKLWISSLYFEYLMM